VALMDCFSIIKKRVHILDYFSAYGIIWKKNGVLVQFCVTFGSSAISSAAAPLCTASSSWPSTGSWQSQIHSNLLGGTQRYAR